VAGRQRAPEHVPGDDAQAASPRPGEILVRVRARGPTHGGPHIGAMHAAGTVIAAGDGVTRFAVGDEVFGHFSADPCARAQVPCARTTADGAHVERRPDDLDPPAAAALAEGGLAAKTILRAAELRPGQTAVVVGATAGAGTELVPVLAEAGVRVIAAVTPDDDDLVRSLGAADTIECTTADPVSDALASHPEADLLVDLVSFEEPYFITARAPHGTILTAAPGHEGSGLPRIGISAEPGELAALARRALDRRRPSRDPEPV
jgi:NADPH:quinone reductase-like Zn-dependent oxidoreductase